MLKERINEILDKNKVSTEGSMRDGLRKDMESLAMDYYTKGEVSLQEILMPKILDLQELAKAQKELLDEAVEVLRNALGEIPFGLLSYDIENLLIKIKENEHI